MFIDQLLQDILGFVKRLLSWRSSKKNEPERKPFTAMRTHSGEWGVISLVIGRDTPRSVRTWIYSSKRWGHSETQKRVKDVPQDLHFYLDFLGPMPNVQTSRSKEERLARQAKRRKGERVMTHRIQILKASHFLNSDGVYDCDLIYWGDFDFHRPGSIDPNKDAVMVLDKLLSVCLRMTDPFSLESKDWEKQVQRMWHHVQGGALEPDDEQSGRGRQTSVRGKRIKSHPGVI